MGSGVEARGHPERKFGLKQPLQTLVEMKLTSEEVGNFS